MNIKQFFRQLRQQRLFSTIYVVCTALSVALAMILFLILYIKFGPVYPEQDRARTAFVTYLSQVEMKTGEHNVSNVTRALADSLRRMPEAEFVTCYESADGYRGMEQVGVPDGRAIPCKTWFVDEHYWQVFGFRFVHGRGLNAEEVKNVSPVCVVSESMARKAFGRTDVVGCTLEFGGFSTDSIMQIVGVVEDVSPALPRTYGHVWISIVPNMISYENCSELGGPFKLAIRLRPGCTVEQLQQSTARFQQRYNQAHEIHGFKVDLMGQPDPHWKAPFREQQHVDAKPFLRQILYLLLAFLLLPAINMGCMVAGRVGGRISELGIRRAYGATRSTLVWQVLLENFLLTLLGGSAGLLLSWIIMNVCADWLPFVFNSSSMVVDEHVALHTDMLFSGWVMLAVLTVCMVLNIVSALVPTLWYLSKPVTVALNHKLD